MGVYLNENGFEKRTLAEIKESFTSTAKTLFGANVDTSDDSPLGQFISIPADGLAEQWDGGEEVYSSVDPSMATGAALDRVCALTGVYRIAAAASVVRALLYATKDNLGSVIPSGAQARRVRGSLVFSLSAGTTIAAGSCQDVYLKFTSAPAAGVTVSLVTTFGSFSVTATSESDDAARSIGTMKLLAEALNESTWGVGSGSAAHGYAQVWDAGVLVHPTQDSVGQCQDTADVCLRLAHSTTAFGVTGYDAFTIALCGSQGKFACSSTGPNTVDPGELSEIVTSETGWEKVVNLIHGTVGRNTETDEELRIRRKASQGQGLATDAAIVNYVNNHVAGVSSVSIASNRSGSVDAAGRPAHSFEVTLEGGEDADVAAAIWHAQPAGIESFGRISVVTPDSQGGAQMVRFTRPSPVAIHVNITYTLYSEEVFPADGETELRDALLAWVSTNCTTGKDVYSGRLAAVCFGACSGLGVVTVLASLTGDAEDWHDVLTIDGSKYATLASGDLAIAKASA